MKHYSLLLLLCMILINGQNRRFFYEYRYAPDSLKKDSLISEQMCLDINTKGSKYFSYTVFHSDSLMKINLDKQLKANGMININTADRKGNIRYSVTKAYPEFTTFLHTRIFTDQYRIEEDRPIKWNVMPEKQKIGNFSTQKAETDFAGRHWIAWFTDEIPIQDGPYKFHGLPGLIVKITSSDGSHQISLHQIKNIGTEETDYTVFPAKEINISPKQYEKLLNDYENDPTKGLKQMSMGTIVMKMENSAENAKWMKERETRMKQNIQKNNNKIELRTK